MSSCQQHGEQFGVGAVEKSNSSGKRKFRFEKILRRETLSFLDNVAREVAEGGVAVSAVEGLDLAKLSSKSAPDCSESSISYKNRMEHFRKMRLAKCAQDC